MGFFRKLFSARRAVVRAMEEQEARLSALAALSPSELSALEDATLCEVLSYKNDTAVTARFGAPHARRQTLAACYATFTGARRTYALCDLFSYEMEQGGLCEVLTGELRLFAAELPQLLRELGATENAARLEAFYHDNGIDPNEMTSFIIGRDLETDRAAQELRFPYAAFNDSLLPLLSCLAAYARAHIEEMIG